jgi:hypothetical protein
LLSDIRNIGHASEQTDLTKVQPNPTLTCKLLPQYTSSI